jgi:two-component system response regulator AtoC
MAFTIMVVEDEETARIALQALLVEKGYEVIGVATLTDARAALQRGDVDVVVLDVRLPDGYGPNLLLETSRMANRPPIILITAFGDIEMAVDAMKNGAHDFLTKPLQFTQLDQSIQRACEVVMMRRELAHYRHLQQQNADFVAGGSKKMKDLLSMAQRAGKMSVSVLVTGETGTGKEILAKFIHQNGPRKNKPLIAINCAAIQPTVLESELFGYEAGAFTGAERRKIGLLEVADNGMLFLDEISSMPLDIQAKILRAIEDHSFRRVGGTSPSPIHVDVHVVAASNRNLPQMIKEGLFREDLYYRLKVVDLNLPPLRERKEDIPELVGFFFRLINPQFGINVREISPRALNALMDYNWPGNIRELKNIIERALLFCDGDMVDLEHLPADILKPL